MNNKVYLEPPVIINTIASYEKITPEQLICTERKREFIKAKHIAMYCFKQFTDFSLARIGMFFNGKDHATVLYAIKSVSNQADVYKAYRTELNEILRKLSLKVEDEYERYKSYETEKV